MLDIGKPDWQLESNVALILLSLALFAILDLFASFMFSFSIAFGLMMPCVADLDVARYLCYSPIFLSLSYLFNPAT